MLATIASGLVERGHVVTVASFDPADAADFYPMHPRVNRCRLSGGNSRLRSSAVDLLRRAQTLRKLALTIRPDVAVGFMHSSFVPLGWALAGTGIPVVASEHIDRSYYRHNPFELLAIRISLPRYSAMTIPSEKVRAGYESAFRKRMVEIPNCLTPFQPSRASGRSAPLILSVGRLAPQKDHKTLVAAFARLAPRFPEWKLRIVGEGELRGDLERQVRQLGMSDRIELPGANAEIGEDYRRATLFALPSRFESFGLVTGEALAHGVPAVGFADCAGTNELIQSGVNGVLVEGADRVVALGNALAGLMSAPGEIDRLGRNGPASVARYSADAVVQRWERFLRGIIEQGGIGK